MARDLIAEIDGLVAAFERDGIDYAICGVCEMTNARIAARVEQLGALYKLGVSLSAIDTTKARPVEPR